MSGGLYPTAYKPGSGAYPKPEPRGFQPGKGSPLPKPANVNVPFPANDPNPPRPPRPGKSSLAGVKPRFRFGLGAALFSDAVDQYTQALHANKNVVYNGSSWTCPGFAGGNINYWHSLPGAGAAACGNGQAVGNTGPGYAADVFQPGPRRILVCHTYEAAPGQWRINVQRGFHVAASTNAMKQYGFAPHTSPGFLPMIDPLSVPPLAPQPAPVPVPFWAQPGIGPNPWRDPFEQPGKGNWASPSPVSPAARPQPKPNPWPAGMPVPSGRPLPNPMPGGLPGVGVGPNVAVWPVPQPGAGPTVELVPPGAKPVGSVGHKPSPPKWNENEKKFVATPKPGTPLAVALSVPGETADFVGALHDALPKAAQCVPGKGHFKCTPQGQAKAVWDNFDQIDWPKAWENLAKNQAEDAAYGALGKALGKAAGKTGRPVGFQTGPAL